jgi:hypothetical protein
VAERAAYEGIGVFSRDFSGRHFQGRSRKEAIGALVRSKQLYQLQPQSLISVAGCVEKPSPVFGWDFERLFQQLIDLAPPFGLHRMAPG